MIGWQDAHLQLKLVNLIEKREVLNSKDVRFRVDGVNGGV